MGKTSCIRHLADDFFIKVHNDYYLLVGEDAKAAAILHLIEFWANAVIAHNPEINNPWIGKKSIRDFESRLVGIATDKQIRMRLRSLESMGFIRIGEADRGSSRNYQFLASNVQLALDNLGQITAVEQPRSNNRGQITVEPRSNNQGSVGQTTEQPRSNNRTTSVKQPNPVDLNAYRERVSEPLRNKNKEENTKEVERTSTPLPPREIESDSNERSSVKEENHTPEVIQGELIELDPSAQQHGGNESSQPKQKRAANLSSEKKLTKADFEEWWQHVGWKTGRKEAERRFLAIKGVDKQVLIDSLIAQQKWHLKNKGHLEFMKRPPTWLYQEAWNDELEPVTSRGLAPETLVAASKASDMAERLRKKFGNQ